MKKFSFLFYYFVIIAIGVLSVFAFCSYLKMKNNYSLLTNSSVKSRKTTVTRIVSIAMSDRIGNLKLNDVEIEYDGSIDSLANKSMEILWSMTKEEKGRIRGGINQESDFLSLSYDYNNKVAYVYVTENFIEDRTDRQRKVAKKQVESTLRDVYRDMEECKFIINDEMYEY